MEILSAKIYQYDLPLAWPLPLKTTKLKSRQGLVVAIKVNNAQQGVGYLYGEAAPLPDFSTESLDEAREQLGAMLSMLVGQTIEPELFNSEALSEEPVFPSVAFALESALYLPVIVSQQEMSQWNESVMPVAPLLTGTTTDMQEKIRSWSSCWPRAFKLKVARGNPEADYYRIKQLLSELPAHVPLRLDANRRWTLEQACEFARNVDTDRITYIEEPVQQSKDCPAFYQNTGMPYAWDETLQNSGFSFYPETGLAAVVIKPTLVGGIRRCEYLISQAREAGVRTVISSSFESILGIDRLESLGRCLAPDEAAGLDTLSAFDRHLFASPVPLWQKLPDKVLQKMELVWH